MKTYLFICIVLLLSNICYSWDPTEQAEAEKILTIIGAQGENLCDVFGCGDDFIYSINLHNLDTYADFSSVDFSLFTRMVELNLGSSSIYGTSNILSQISTLTDLQQFTQTNLIESSNVDLPNSLISLQMDNFKGTFYAKWVTPELETLIVGNTQDFSLSGTIPTSSNLYSLTFPVPSNGLPSNLDQIFPSLTSLTIYMKDVTSYTGSGAVPSSYMGSYNFKNLVTLIFTFDSNTTSISKPINLPDFSQINTLFVFRITGEFFILNQNQILNVSANPIGKLSFTIENTNNLLKDCKNCIRVSENTQCSLNNVNVTIDNIDFSKCSKIKLSTIIPVQQTTFKSFNFDRLTGLDIAGTSLYGDLVDDICKIDYNYVNIKANLFAGKVPSCYLCASPNDYLIRSKIIPNKFTNFDANTPSSCPGFQVNYNSLYLVKTQGDSIIINGKDLGFSVQVTGATYTYESLNYRINVKVPAYTGGDGSVNKTITIRFLYTNQVISFNYHYAPPTISSYIYGNGNVAFIGSGFDFNDETNNKLTINPGNHQYTVPAALSQGFPSALQFDNSDNFFVDNQSYEISIEVGNQVSPVLSFEYTQENINITTEDIVLESTGSTFTISGLFYSNDITKTQLFIGNVQCTITKMTSTSITFIYPPSNENIGSSFLLLVVNNKFNSVPTTVQYVESSSSSSSSSSSTSTSTSSTSTSNSSTSNSDSDSVNSSSKLNFNLIGLISFILISILSI